MNGRKKPAAPNHRIRLSVWAHHTFLAKYPKRIDGGKGIIDDLSLLRVVQHDDYYDKDSQSRMPITGPNEMKLKEWRPDVAELEESRIETVIRRGHKNGIQVLAGYGFTGSAQPNESDSFVEWLEYLVKVTDEGRRFERDAEISRFANQFITFLGRDFNGVRFDGISFDIEAIPVWTHLSRKDREIKALKIRDVLIQFYQTVHDGLALAGLIDRNLLSRVVAVAAGQLVAHGQRPGVLPRNQWLGFFQPLGKRTAPCPSCNGACTTNCQQCGGRGKVEISSISKGNPAHPGAIAHDYRMARDRPYFIVRPMAYDSFEPRTNPSIEYDRMEQWHLDIVDYALSLDDASEFGANIRPWNFQLGIKNFEGVNNRRPDGKDSIMLDVGKTCERCTQLRNRGVGLCVFNLPSKKSPALFWEKVARYNFALNSTPGKSFDKKNPAAGTFQTAVEGQPFQAPHDPASLARLRVF